MILELILSLAVFVDVVGSVSLNCDPSSPEDQASMTCICRNPTKNGIEWRVDSVVTTACLGSSDSCFPVVAGYTSDVSKDEFYAEVNPYTYSSCANYSCKDATTGDEVPFTTSINDFDSSMPTAITEPGSNKNGTIQITTNCLFKETDIIVKWYTISKTGRTKDYKPKTKFSTPTSCTDATKICNGERAVTLNIGFEHTEKRADCVKFKLEVYHSANSSDKIELQTTGDYCIKGPCWCWCWWGCCDDIGMCILCWLVFILIICIILYIIGIIIGIILTNTNCCCKCFYHCKDSDCCECCHCCGENNYVRCKCCASWPCGVLCNINQLPFWYQILWAAIIGIPVALGIYTIWRCCGRGNGDVDPRVGKPRNETQSGNPHTGQKKSETKKNKSKDSVAQIENEQLYQGKKNREQPPLPSDAGAATGTTLHGREDSDSAVSREHVHVQESGQTLKQSFRPMPAIPRSNDRQGHDSKGRGLSANFNDDDHLLIGINTPSQKANALDALPEGTGGEGQVKKLKKKKKKSKDQEDEV